MFSANPNLQLLSAILILVRPLGIIFLHDLTGLDDPLDFVDEGIANTHYAPHSSSARNLFIILPVLHSFDAG